VLRKNKKADATLTASAFTQAIIYYYPVMLVPLVSAEIMPDATERIGCASIPVNVSS
jgi:hypothetical protein